MSNEEIWLIKMGDNEESNCEYCERIITNEDFDIYDIKDDKYMDYTRFNYHEMYDRREEEKETLLYNIRKNKRFERFIGKSDEERAMILERERENNRREEFENIINNIKLCCKECVKKRKDEWYENNSCEKNKNKRKRIRYQNEIIKINNINNKQNICKVCEELLNDNIESWYYMDINNVNFENTRLTCDYCYYWLKTNHKDIYYIESMNEIDKNKYFQTKRDELELIINNNDNDDDDFSI